MTRVQVCGITSAKDALMCEELGADALGFVRVGTSKRCVELDFIRDTVSVLGPFIFTVLICDKNALGEARYTGVDCVQLYSDDMNESKAIKESGFGLIGTEKLAPICDIVLFDESHGKGKENNHDLIKEKAASYKRFAIGGGLTPSNVARALALKPYALNVSSGVEKEFGKKDKALVEAFIKAVKQ